MASPGEFVTLTALSAADLNALPGGVLGYAQVTSNQGSITSETNLTGLSVTVDVPASRRIQITGSVAALSSNSGDIARLRVKESTTDLAFRNLMVSNTGNPEGLSAIAVVTPSTGSHTYHLSLERVGTGAVSMNAAANAPAFILVEDIGPA